MFKNIGQFNYSDGYCYTKIYIVADIEGKTIHLMDLNEKGTHTLTNTARVSFITIVYKHVQKIEAAIKHSRDEYRYFLYHTDGKISEFKEDKLFPVNEKKEIFPNSFIKVIKERKEVYRTTLGVVYETDTAKKIFKQE